MAWVPSRGRATRPAPMSDLGEGAVHEGGQPLLDQGQRNTLVASHAKRFAADSAMEVTINAVQV